MECWIGGGRNDVCELLLDYIVTLCSELTQQGFFSINHSESDNSYLKTLQTGLSILNNSIVFGLSSVESWNATSSMCKSNDMESVLFSRSDFWSFSLKCLWCLRSWSLIFVPIALCRGSVWHVRMVRRVTAICARRTPCCREKMTRCGSG